MVLAAASQAQTSSTLPFNLIPTLFHKDCCNFEKDRQRKDLHDYKHKDLSDYNCLAVPCSLSMPSPHRLIIENICLEILEC